MSRVHSLNRRVNKADSGPKFLRLGDGKILSGERFQGGKALKSVPRAMRDEASLHRKLLTLMAHVRDTTGLALLPRELAKMYLDYHSEPCRKNTLNDTLSQLFTLGLVDRMQVNKKEGRWSLKKGIDVHDTPKLLTTCEASLTKLRRKEVKMHRLPNLR